jgi:HlyD family secretion protein
MRMHFQAALIAACLTGTACKSGPEPDAYGNFEATEVQVSAQTAGQIEQFIPTEGMHLSNNAFVALIDTTQLALERQQILAQRNAAGARSTESSRQVGVLIAQRVVAQRNYERTRRLVNEHAATAQQLDAAERDYRTILAQINAGLAQTQSVRLDAAATDARLAQIRDRIAKSRVTNPESGTVLAVYSRQGEMIEPGQPLYKIANLDTLTLRAYATENQLSSFRLGRSVAVTVDRDGQRRSLNGTVTWVSSTAEFTPTPVQTRDDRASLVYAVKIRVANPNGELKIGMPADVVLPPAGATVAKQ